MGSKAGLIKWINCDILDFNPSEEYDLWHDRAVFHFLNSENEILNYVEKANRYLANHGKLVLGTFSENGPTKCSGIATKQYSEQSIEEQFKKYFSKLNCQTSDHQTPSGAIQNFLFCTLQKNQ